MNQLTVDDLFRLTPWRRPAMDLSIYADLEWEHPQTGRVYPLGASYVALEGTSMRLLVRPADSEEYAVIRVKGFLRHHLITEAAAPSKAEINAKLEHYRRLGVIESDICVP